MFVGGKKLMARREMWTVSRDWEAPGKVFCKFKNHVEINISTVYMREWHAVTQHGNVDVSIQKV